MRGVLGSTNSTIYFILLRTAAVPSLPSFYLLPPLCRSRYRQRKPPIDGRAFLQVAASGSPMEFILKNGSDELKRSEEKGESPTPQVDECPSSSSDLPPQPPEKPEPGDCCGNGCFPCIWDLYYDELEAYNISLEAYKDRISSKQK